MDDEANPNESQGIVGVVKSWFIRGALIGLIPGLCIGGIYGFVLSFLNEPFFGEGVATISAVSVITVMALAFSLGLGLVFAILAALFAMEKNFSDSKE